MSRPISLNAHCCLKLTLPSPSLHEEGSPKCSIKLATIRFGDMTLKEVSRKRDAKSKRKSNISIVIPPRLLTQTTSAT